ncbi:hypothetical protein F8M49_08145 [Rhodococcus zopfii]|uniref:Uncharacterized protein n=1 Tax=Rhodococcus zopfii TaxID=43772 RepID=A0ABU3WPR0_9NOCA|nr:hypothetical protein [Rhodococcus zopfii]
MEEAAARIKLVAATERKPPSSQRASRDLLDLDVLSGLKADDTVIYPGHGKDSTRGAERPHLREWRESAVGRHPRRSPQ